MKFIFFGISILHGFIHLMGFLKAFGLAEFPELHMHISEFCGISWLLASFLFILSATFFILKKNFWWIFALFGVLISQILIITFWQDSKFGTLANIVIFIASVGSCGNFLFEQSFKRDVKKYLNEYNVNSHKTLTESDLHKLPILVQKYLRVANVIGKPVPENFRVVFNGKMDRGKNNWFSFRSVQYNFFEKPARFFFMKGNLFGFTVPGYHNFCDAQAFMDIKLFGLIPIVKISGKVLDETETVTLFNDMCLFAPASLINKNIQWQEINDNSVKAVFTNQQISISAILSFDSEGKLINFVSEDRTDISDMKKHPFETPITKYDKINGNNLMSYGEAVWKRPEADFIYGKFNLHEIEYNIDHFRG